MKALLSFSPSKFYTWCFQARVKLAPPYLVDEDDDERGQAHGTARDGLEESRRIFAVLRQRGDARQRTVPQKQHELEGAVLRLVPVGM